MSCSVYAPLKPNHPDRFEAVNFSYTLVVEGVADNLQLDVTMYLDAVDDHDEDPNIEATYWEPNIPLCENTILEIQEQGWEARNRSLSNARTFRRRCGGL